jgi:hypothetical protein
VSWTYVNSGGNNNTAGSGNITLSWSPTLGNVLYAATANYSGNITSIGDGHNTWTRVAQANHSSANGSWIDLWTAPVTTGGALTITATGQSFGVLGVLELTPSGTVSADGSVAISGGSGMSFSTGNITIAGGDLVLGVFGCGTTGFSTWTPGSGYTTAFSFPYGGSVGFMLEYALSVTGPTADPGATITATNTWSALGAAFLAAAGSAGGLSYFGGSSILKPTALPLSIYAIQNKDD